MREEIDVKRNDRVFSDGVGMISTSVMYKIWDKLSKASLAKPTCFQIRYAGKSSRIAVPSLICILGLDLQLIIELRPG